MPTGIIRVRGTDKTIDSLNKAIKKIRFRSKQGMIRAGFFIQREAQKITPVDLGNLRASASTVWDTGGGGKPAFKGDDAEELRQDHSSLVSSERAKLSKNLWKPEVEVIYSAYYTIYVHENLEAAHSGRGEAQFLKKAIDRNRAKILAIIREEIKG